jgi:hypothetical protein
LLYRRVPALRWRSQELEGHSDAYALHPLLLLYALIAPVHDPCPVYRSCTLSYCLLCLLFSLNIYLDGSTRICMTLCVVFLLPREFPSSVISMISNGIRHPDLDLLQVKRQRQTYRHHDIEISLLSSARRIRSIQSFRQVIHQKHHRDHALHGFHPVRPDYVVARPSSNLST